MKSLNIKSSNDFVSTNIRHLSVEENKLQNNIDQYIFAKKQNRVNDIDCISLMKNLQSMIDFLSQSAKKIKDKSHPMVKRIGYYYAILKDVEGLSKQLSVKVSETKTVKPQTTQKTNLLSVELKQYMKYQNITQDEKELFPVLSKYFDNYEAGSLSALNMPQLRDQLKKVLNILINMVKNFKREDERNAKQRINCYYRLLLEIDSLSANVRPVKSQTVNKSLTVSNETAVYVISSITTPDGSIEYWVFTKDTHEYLASGKSIDQAKQNLFKALESIEKARIWDNKLAAAKNKKKVL